MPGIYCDFPTCKQYRKVRCPDCGFAYCTRHMQSHVCSANLVKREIVVEPVIDKEVGERAVTVGRIMLIAGLIALVAGIGLLPLLGPSHTVAIAGLLISGGVVALMVLGGFASTMIGIWVLTAGLNLRG